MKQHELILYPDARLKKPSSPLTLEEFDDVLAARVDQMRLDVRRFFGYALAAPQIGIHKRFFVLVDSSPELQRGIIGDVPPVMCNPVIIDSSDVSPFKESCLSLPGVSAYNMRPRTVLISYQDVKGLPRRALLTGTLAVVASHELDHLDGKLFIDQLQPFELNRVIKRINKLRLK